jgi:HAD superfamily hydrolase (TIGR01509 family)
MWAAWARWLGVPGPAMFAALGATIERGVSHREALALIRPGVDVDAETDARAAAGDPDGFRPEDVYPDARPALAELRRSGRRVGMAGNTGRSAEAVLAAVGEPGDLITSSEAVGAEKPAPAFFRALADLAGEPPERIAYVGDRLDNDVLPAQAAGMTGVHIRRGPWGVLHAARPRPPRPICGSTRCAASRSCSMRSVPGGEAGRRDRGPDPRTVHQRGVVHHLDLVADVLRDRTLHVRQPLDRLPDAALTAAAVHAGDRDQRPLHGHSPGLEAAAAATYAATSTASWPFSSSAGMGGSDEVAPTRICSLTMASNEERSQSSLAGPA